MAKILIAEPDEFGRRLLTHMLTKDGHIVCSVADAFGALDTAVGFQPDIVMLSAVLPKGRPQDVLRRLALSGINPKRVIGLGHLGSDHSSLPTAHAWLLLPMGPSDIREALNEHD